MNLTRNERPFTKLARRLSPLAFLAVFGNAAADHDPLDSARVMFVGHSLINQQIPAMMQEIALSLGWGSSYMVQEIPGSPLGYNWLHCRAGTPETPSIRACDELDTANPPFDVLVGTEANNPISGNYDFWETPVALENFMSLLLSRDSDAQSFIYTSWESLDYHADWLGAIEGELALFETIRDEAAALSIARGQNGSVHVIPANLALRELIIRIENGDVPGLNTRTDIFLDQVHANSTGNYYLASVIFASIYKRSPIGAQSSFVPDALAQQLQTIAWDVVSNYDEDIEPTTVPRPPIGLQAN